MHMGPARLPRYIYVRLILLTIAVIMLEVMR